MECQYESNIRADTHEIRDAGTKVNEHIAWDKNRTQNKVNENVQRVLRLSEGLNMKVMSQSEKCQGRCTWMKRQQVCYRLLE
jgi:hypothetical protein